MTQISFSEINTKIGDDVFTINGDVITLNINKITGDSYTALDDGAIMEFAFKFLKLCYETQEDKNRSLTTRIRSFSAPFYSTVTNGSPPTIEGSITFTGVVPLNINELVGR